MRSPRLALITTLIIWTIFVMAFMALVLWRGDIAFGFPYGLTVFLVPLALIGALLQTRFLLRNMRVSFTPDKADEPDKLKRQPRNNLADFVNTLDEQERAELYGMLDDQVDERFRH